jgi:hypothetical protein
MTAVGRYAQYRAPRDDGAIFSEPPWDDLSRLLQANRKQRAAIQLELWGRSFADLAHSARREALVAAHAYTANYADLPTSDPQLPLVMTGHQPEMVHPGVWLKNYAAARLSKTVGGHVVNLVIDSDLCRAASLRVPTGSIKSPRIEHVAYDANHDAMPYEERPLLDREIWRSFGRRATEALRPLVANPLVANWWEEFAVSGGESARLGLAIAQARHRQELAWGGASSELPQSLLCQSPSFHLFLLHLLIHAARFRNEYNAALAAYREAHHIRTTAQPVPDLKQLGEWIETPFWVWSKHEPQRQALFVQPRREGMLLSDRHGWQGELAITPDGATEPALTQLSDWSTAGIKLRTRALATTLYARLFVADLFIHGIGGAKYDQATDDLCRRFFQVELPPYQALSGTLRLPIEHASAAPETGRDLRARLRDVRYHPEQFRGELSLQTAESEMFDRAAAEKHRWIATLKTPATAAQRHQGIVAANEAMQRALGEFRGEIERSLAEFAAQRKANFLLESREFAFCLFPLERLRKFMLDF